MRIFVKGKTWGFCHKFYDFLITEEKKNLDRVQGGHQEAAGLQKLSPCKGGVPEGGGGFADAYVNGLYALQFVEGQLIGGRDAYDDFEDSYYCGGYSAMGM